MSTVSEIKKAITKLSPQERELMAKLRPRLADDQWDKQMKRMQLRENSTK